VKTLISPLLPSPPPLLQQQQQQQQQQQERVLVLALTNKHNQDGIAAAA